ncbi:MAG: hypothetical protein M1358_12705 [Chloroflexi bacterium]|nr:hypothetical protein [Chloroflexota bacterium]
MSALSVVTHGEKKERHSHMETDQIVLVGSEEEQKLAKRVFTLMARQGAMFGLHSPIRQSLSNLTEFFLSQGLGEDPGELSQAIDRALTENDSVFGREEVDGQVFFITSKSGRYAPPVEVPEDTSHTFKSRLWEPPAAPVVEEEKAPPLRRARVRRTMPLPEIVEVEVPEERVEAEEVVPVERQVRAVPTELLVAPGVVVDLTRHPDEIYDEYGVYFEDALEAALQQDFRFVSFGPDWFLEDMVERFSKGDLRRIKEYIVEASEPLPDNVLLTDLFGKRTSDPDYEYLRFSLNYRLFREKRDFEFVGVNTDRLWSTTDLPPVGLQKRRASEIGTDFRYLEEPGLHGEPAAVEGEAEAQRIEHYVTYYEYENGLLPYDDQAKRILPWPLLEEQHAALIKFAVPQLYATFNAELRYPTSSRGGWITGLDVFFLENLVPGAKIIIGPTEQENAFTIEYVKAPVQEAELLQFDERKARFVFVPTTFSVEIGDKWILSRARFPRLQNTKRLEDRERKRPEIVVANAFEHVGERVGEPNEPRFWALLDDLLAVVNIERPFSAEYLRSVLDSDQNQQFYRDEEEGDAFFYEPRKP